MGATAGSSSSDSAVCTALLDKPAVAPKCFNRLLARTGSFKNVDPLAEPGRGLRNRGLARDALGAQIDELTVGQQEYLASWRQGS